MKKIVLFVILASVVSFSAMAQKTEVLHFIVESGACLRINTPVSVDIEWISKSDTTSFQLFAKTKGQLVER